MFNQSFPQYIKSEDGISLYVCTNFDPQEKHDNESIIFFNCGLVCSNAHWEKQIPYLEQKGMKILVHHYRGHFNSQGSDDIKKITFSSITNDLNIICKRLKINKVIMISHSMGVNISLEFAKRFPNKIAGQILISGTIFPPHDIAFNSQATDLVFSTFDFVHKNFPDIYQKFWKTSRFNPLFRSLIHKGGFHLTETSPEFIQVYLARIAKLPPEIFIHLIKEMKDHDILKYLHQIKTPTLIMGGDEDKVIPFSIQRAIHAKIPHSELYIIKDGSHVPQVDFANSTNNRISLFLEKI